MAKKVLDKNWKELTVMMLDIGVEFDFTTLPNKMKEYCGFHGYIQKLRDDIVSLGKGATTEDKRKAIVAMDARLRKEEWFKTGITRKKMVGKAVFIEKSMELGYTAEQAQEQWGMFYED